MARSPVSGAGPRRTATAVIAVGLCAWCGWASGFHRSSAGARATWLGSLGIVAAAAVLAHRGRRGRRPAWHPAHPRSRPAGGPPAGRALLAWYGPWLVLGVVALAWDVLGLDTGRREAHLTISALSQAFRPLHAALLLGWILVGIGFVAVRDRMIRAGPAGGSEEPGTPGADRGVTAPLAAAAAAATHHAAVAGAPPAGVPALLEGGNRGVGVAFWAAVGMAGAVIEIVARHRAGRYATASDLLAALSRPLAGRVVAAGVWAFAGWHLFSH